MEIVFAARYSFEFFLLIYVIVSECFVLVFVLCCRHNFLLDMQSW